jgi:hypothetical protein
MACLQHFHGTVPHSLTWAGLRTARAKITVGGIPTCLIDCDVFIVDTHFTNVERAAGWRPVPYIVLPITIQLGAV